MAHNLDLIDNHDGYLSRSQKQMLWWRAIRYMVGYCVGAVVVCFFIAAWTRFNVTDVALVVGAIAFFVIWGRWQFYSREITDGWVEVLAGPVELGIEEIKSSPRFSLTCDGKTLQITSKILLSFKNGDPYLVYVTPITNIFLGAEPLEMEYAGKTRRSYPRESLLLGDDGELLYPEYVEDEMPRRKHAKHHKWQHP
jgi:hypothetical protein